MIRFFLLFILVIHGFLVTNPVLAQQTQLDKLNILSTKTDLQLIVSSSTKLKYNVFLLKQPDRLVIDLFNVQFDKALDQPSSQHPLVYRFRKGIKNKTDLRIVADLKMPIHYTANSLDPIQDTLFNFVVKVQSASSSDQKFSLNKKEKSKKVWDKETKLPKKKLSTHKLRKKKYIDFDDPTNASHQITPWLSFGSSFELQFELQQDYDLSSTNEDKLEELQPSVNFAFLYHPQDWFNAFIEFNLTHDYLIQHPEQSRRKETVFAIKLAHMNFKGLLPGLSLKIGRQRHKDPREWWYDENLDAVRLLYSYQKFAIEFSASRKEIIGNDLLNADSQEKIDNYLVAAHYKLSKKNEVNTYFLFREDRFKRQRSPIYFGIQSLGKITSSLKYWVDTAALLGSTRNKDLKAFAFDFGSTYAPKLRFKPSLTLGVAFGSGDKERDNTDETFRQTDLEDNNGKFNGVTKFKYYGELTDPELSNIWILTAGLGLKPLKKGSIDFIYHYYRQHHLDDHFRSDIEIDPDGKDKDIGHELDIVLGYRAIKNLSTELIFGTFIPGKAFSDAFDNAFFGKVEVNYRY